LYHHVTMRGTALGCRSAQWRQRRDASRAIIP